MMIYCCWCITVCYIVMTSFVVASCPGGAGEHRTSKRNSGWRAAGQSCVHPWYLLQNPECLGGLFPPAERIFRYDSCFCYISFPFFQSWTSPSDSIIQNVPEQNSVKWLSLTLSIPDKIIQAEFLWDQFCNLILKRHTRGCKLHCCFPAKSAIQSNWTPVITKTLC